jgi:alkylhydroperoxidase family enzyme
MSRRRVPSANAAGLQALLRPAGDGEPRIAPVPPRELGPLARTVATVTGRITGTPPHIFTTLGQHPRLFRSWLRYSAHLMPFGKLSRRDTELVILRVAWQCHSTYEWHQHVPIALRVGLTPDEVAAVADGSAADGVTERQRALLAACDELLAARALTDRTWSALHTNLSDREAIELCLLIGHYQGLASAIGGLAIQIEQDPG